MCNRPERLLTVPEVAALQALSARTIWNRVKTGTLKVVRDGRAVRVRPSDLEAYREANTRRGNARPMRRRRVTPTWEIPPEGLIFPELALPRDAPVTYPRSHKTPLRRRF